MFNVLFAVCVDVPVSVGLCLCDRLLLHNLNFWCSGFVCVCVDMTVSSSMQLHNLYVFLMFSPLCVCVLMCVQKVVCVCVLL